MSGTPPAARFRIRLEDGSEVLVSSVEALARRVQRGDVGPDTPLYDGSTGAWSRAGDAPVVRFILEDIAAEGGDAPPEWEPATPDSRPESGVGAATGVGSSATHRPTETRDEGIDDPLDFGITVAEPTPEAFEVAPSESPAPLVPPETKRAAKEDRDWLTHSQTDELHPALPPDPPSTERAVGFGHPARRPEAPRSAAPRRSGTARPREEGLLARSTPRPTWIALAAGGLVLIVAFAILGRPDEDPSTGSTFPGATGAGGQSLVSVQSAAAAQAPPPTDLAADADRALASFAARIQDAADSLSTVHGVEGAPPPQWLGGPYLADAQDYPEIREFWEGYGRMVRDLRSADRAVFTAVVNEAASRLGDRPTDARRLSEYLEARYAAMAPSRDGRADQLIEAATLALALHDFLISATQELRYTPALGSAVPRDPVIEVGTDNPRVLEALNDHLDRLFEALDRSRGGGALSQGGLREDLFLGFGVL